MYKMGGPVSSPKTLHVFYSVSVKVVRKGVWYHHGEGELPLPIYLYAKESFQCKDALILLPFPREMLCSLLSHWLLQHRTQILLNCQEAPLNQRLNQVLLFQLNPMDPFRVASGTEITGLSFYTC